MVLKGIEDHDAELIRHADRLGRMETSMAVLRFQAALIAAAAGLVLEVLMRYIPH